MAAFYTNVQVSRDNILYIGYDEEGARLQEKKSYSPSVFLETGEGSYKSFYDVPLKRKQFDKISEMKDFLDTYQDSGMNIHGNFDSKYSFISDTFKDDISFDFSRIHCAYIDIETTSKEGFPDAYTATEMINVITLYSSFYKKFYVFTLDGFGQWDKEVFIKEYGLDVEHIPCETEKEMLEQFISLWINRYPDILTGWNIDKFDVPFLINRIHRILGEGYVKSLSPWNIVSEKKSKDDFGNPVIYYDILGISILDYIDYYKKFRLINRKSYKLDYIASIELGYGKLNHDEYETFEDFYTKDYSKFVSYNVVDVLIVLQLDKKFGYLNLIATLAYMAKINFEDVSSPVKFWEMMIFNDFRKEKRAIPPKEIKHKDTQFQGAYVLDPQIGLHEWVVSFDLASLYPHVVMQYNISPENIVEGVQEHLNIDKIVSQKKAIEHLPYDDCCLTASGYYYKNDPDAIMPRLMSRLYQQRKYHQKQKKLYGKDTNEFQKHDSFQYAIKIAINSLYGCLGTPYFRYYDVRNAESVTLTGQLSIKWIYSAISDFMKAASGGKETNPIVAGDTDSIAPDSVISLKDSYETIENIFNKAGQYLVNDVFNEHYVKTLDEPLYAVSMNMKNGEVETKKINYVMKHKVKKRLYKINTPEGEITVTGDHSIIVYDKVKNKFSSIKPAMIDSKKHSIINIFTINKIVSIKKEIMLTDDYQIEDLGEIEEYVYDIEVEDNHNFVANNVLVHNSAYISFQTFVETRLSGKTDSEICAFLSKLCETKMQGYISDSYQKLSNIMYCDKSIMNMERESICRRAIWRAKKNYACLVMDSEGTIYDEPVLKVKGLESVTSKYSDFVTQNLEKTYMVMLSTDKDKRKDAISTFMDSFKKDFMQRPIEDISRITSIKGLDKYISKADIYSKDLSVPIHVRAALLYNHYIQEMGLDKKYPLVRNGDKIRFCHLKTPNKLRENVIAFSSSFPKEIIDPSFIDRIMLYEKSYEGPIQSLLDAIGISMQNSLEDFF